MKEPKAVKKMKRKALISNKKKMIITALCIFILIFGVYIGLVSHTWKVLAKDMTLSENSIVVDTQGNQIAKLGEEKKKIYAVPSEIPDVLKNAYVAIEDERFYKHHGIDLKRTTAAIFSYIFHFGSSSYGGSTITQQLVKNYTGDSTDSIFRKVKEWWKAIMLETELSKDEVLNAYLNAIYVGPNLYGVQTGAKYYFNKTVSNLSVAECAYLAGINNSPNSYNPFSGKDNADLINKRTKTVLSKMKDLEYISEDTYDTAVAEVDRGLNFVKGNIPDNEPVYSYHTDALIPEVISDIANKYHISQTFAENYVNNAGLTIHSTQITSIQNQAEAEFEKSKYIRASSIGNGHSQAAMVIMDHKTGGVVACVGELGKKTESRPFNRATQSLRQTGSSSKPLILLVPGIKEHKFTASTIYDDTEQDFADGYHPTDYSKALGNITVRRAVESSQNIPFVEMMEEIEPSKSIKYLKKMGISSLTEKDNNLPLALGGLDKGISPLEMAGAYSTIANDGKYIEPAFYTKADRKNGETVIKAKQKSRRVFSKEVAYIIKDLLKEPVEGTNGTATYCKISGVDVAAKTGTTDENYDRWLCGFTPYYTATCWYGYDSNEPVQFGKKNPAGLLWANVMSRIHAGLKSATFEKPNAVTTLTICAETGKVARTGCTHIYKENYLWFTTPGECDKHTGSKYKDKSAVEQAIDEIIPSINTDIDAEEPQRNSEPIPEEPNNVGGEESNEEPSPSPSASISPSPNIKPSPSASTEPVKPSQSPDASPSESPANSPSPSAPAASPTAEISTEN